MRRIATALALLVTTSLLAAPATEKKKEEERKPGTYDSQALGGLSFRGIGPAITSGRMM